MAYHHSNGGGTIGGTGGGGSGSLRGISGEYSGDERESRSGGEERPDSDLHDKPIYLLEHLATFTVNKESGIIYPADGMRRLLQLEKTTGIWSQKMQLCLDYQWVLIMDYETGNIIERFPATLIQEPTAFTSTDAMELYNNILVFIVSGGNGSRSEMHIFQSQSISAVHLVEDLKNLRSGKMITQQRETTQQQVNTSSTGMTKSMIATTMHGNNHRSEQYHQQNAHHRGGGNSSIDQYGMRDSSVGPVGDVSHAIIQSGCSAGRDGETDSENGIGLNDETSSTSSDKYERDVTVLNHCFDDIEKFIARLQHAAAASRELERRRRNRKTKKKDPGEGLLTLRTRPPHEKEFVDIFAKFKLSFNLLAKLKAHIHDPNAPELVHFLFTPLALIVEASSDTYYESQLPGRVVNPLLTREAINLLINCVTSKETELWRSLGDAWIIPRDQWKEDNVGSYHPVFLDGWSPDYLVVDELLESQTSNMNKRRVLEAQIQSTNPLSSSINGRGITAIAVGGNSGYDDYDDSVISTSEKYKVHHAKHAPSANNDHRTAEHNNTASGVGTTADFSTRSEISIDSIERSGGMAATHQSHITSTNHTSGPSGSVAPNSADVMQSIAAGLQNMYTRDGIRSAGNGLQSEFGGMRGGGVATPNFTGSSGVVDDQMLEAWLENMQSTGAKIVLVTYPRTANNDKELSVVRGEYLEILDDTRKWWKARNLRGQIAHVPHTIVAPYNYGDTESSNQFYGQHQQNNYKSRHTANANERENVEQQLQQHQQRSVDTTDWRRNKHIGKKGEFRYF